MSYQDKFVQVEGLKARDIEAGSGPAVVLLQGPSLGSSADADRCKHLIQWDALDEFHRLAANFLRQ
jgi:hypothetical protein